MTAFRSGSTNSDTPGARTALTYLLIGGGIGAAVALLFAPKAGSDLRGDISDLTRKGYDGTLDLANRLKEQSAELYQTMKDRTEKVYYGAADKLSNVREEIADRIDTNVQTEPRAQLNSEFSDKKEKLSGKSTNVF